jgi:hypothetical protein
LGGGEGGGEGRGTVPGGAKVVQKERIQAGDTGDAYLCFEGLLLCLNVCQDFCHARFQHHATHDNLIKNVVHLVKNELWGGCKRKRERGREGKVELNGPAHSLLVAQYLVDVENQVEFADVFKSAIERLHKDLEAKGTGRWGGEDRGV